MPRCTVCIHPEAEVIDGALLKGVTLDNVADRFGLHRSSVRRHNANHLGGRRTVDRHGRKAATFDAPWFRSMGNELAERAKDEAEAGNAHKAHQLMLSANYAWGRADALADNLEEGGMASALDAFLAHLTGDGDDDGRPPLRAVE